MINHSRDVPQGTELSADVCVVGGGPAGITVALALHRSTKLRVIVLESGGLESEPQIQRLNEGENSGLDYYDLAESRLRVLGGSSHLWPGWCRPLDRVDFERRAWVPDSGWPISHEDLLPYYRRAIELCQLEGDRWEPDPARPLSPLYRKPFCDNDIEIALWQASPPTRFGDVYRAEVDASSDTRVLVDATATEVRRAETTRDRSDWLVSVGSLGGNRFRVAAPVVVLAAGAIETARLLLASRSDRPSGLGNENDNVGRYFMEHPHLVTGYIEVDHSRPRRRAAIPEVDRGWLGARARMKMQRPTGATKVAYTISPDRMAQDQLLNFSTHLQTVSSVDRNESEAYAAFRLILGNLRSPRRVLSQMRTGSLPAGTRKVLGQLVRGAPEIASVIYREALSRPRRLALYSQTEQSPNRSSRVTLLDNRLDPLGVPRVNLEWRLNRLDKESAQRSQAIVGAALERAGLGRTVPEPSFATSDQSWGSQLRGGHHHLGTARMSADPKRGVVDRHGELHTNRGVFVADSAVFPTVGYANPLLTIVAWAGMVADTVAARFGRG